MTQEKIFGAALANNPYALSLDPAKAGAFQDGFEQGAMWMQEQMRHIDEDRLNEIALREYPEDDDEFEPLFNITQHNLREVFKAGYRAAKQE